MPSQAAISSTHQHARPVCQVKPVPTGNPRVVVLGIIVVVTLVLLITQPIRIETLAVLVIAAVGLSGLLTPEEALSGFSNSATLTIAAMFVLSAGLQRAGVVDYIGSTVARHAHGGATIVLLLMGIPTVLFSAFMNNTVIVALMIPVAMTIGRKTDVPASKILLPTSYLSILAGTCTLIGSSTNILVNSLYRQAGGPGFHMFEFSSLGLIYLLFGGLYVVLVVPRLLPRRASPVQPMEEAVVDQFFAEVVIPPESRLVGQAIETGFGEHKDVSVLELIRDKSVRQEPVSETELEEGDVILIRGTARAVYELIHEGVVVQTSLRPSSLKQGRNGSDDRIVEAVVAPNSRLLHRRVRRLMLERRGNIQIVAVRPLGRSHRFSFRPLRLRSGDVLLLKGQSDTLHALQEAGEVLLIEGVEQRLTFPKKAPLAIGILMAVVALAALNVAPISILAVAGVGAMLLTGCLTLQHATRALDPAVLLLLAAMIPLGLAMEKTGLAKVISEAVAGFGSQYGAVIFVGAFYLLTTLLTEVLSNNASAVLLTPICLGVAAAAGIDPKPLLVAVTFGASASFATPVGYQTNLMVMGPGGYLVRDYLRVGVPLNILMLIVASLLIPILWPP